MPANIRNIDYAYFSSIYRAIFGHPPIIEFKHVIDARLNGRGRRESMLPLWNTD